VDQLRQNAICHIFVDRAFGLGEINLGEPALGFELVGLQIRLTALGEAESENGPTARSVEQERPVAAGAALAGTRHALLDDATAKIGVDLPALGAPHGIQEDCIGQVFLASEAPKPPGHKDAHAQSPRDNL
jgi:hypothetical protein